MDTTTTANEYHTICGILVNRPIIDGSVIPYRDNLYRVRISDDYDTSINDIEGYGSISPLISWRNRRMQRPSGFNGAAVKLNLRDGFVWWQPPEHFPLPLSREEVSKMRYLVEYGFLTITVERIEDRKDAYGRSIVADYESVRSVEWDADITEYLPELILELAERI